jgi:prepilin-type N-terminal cleavage/methylation domain-containing protein
MRFTSFRFLRSKKAFSLVELSVVIIIVGIFIAGVTQGAKMVNTFRLQSAQTLTLSSPVVSTSGLVLWLEPTMPQSFLDVESVDGSQITKWIDRNPQATVKLSANGSASAGIVYKEQSDIYGLPAVAFSGSSSAVLTLNNGSSNIPIITPNSAYTLFVVAKLSDDSSSALKTVFSNGDSSGWGYGVSGSQNNRSRNLIFSGSSDVTSATANATTRPEVISALYAGGAGGNLQLFTNGVGNAGTGEAGTSESLSASTATAITPTSAFYVGNKSSAAPWTGLISEIIIFNRTLSTKERNSIELYLGQKYNIKTATTGNIEGCPVSIAGVTQTRVDEGASSLPCLATGYSGTVAYDCSGGTLTPSGSCAVFQCAINGELGIINGTMANYAASSTPFTCNDSASGYSGSINYTCTNGGGFNKVSGNCSATVCTINNSLQPSLNDKTNLPYAGSATAVPTTPTAACATGYAGSPTYTCTTSGEATIVTPCTPIQCSVGAPAYNAKTLNYTTVATAIPNTPTAACATGYTGSPTYTCTTPGPVNIVSGACAAITCSITSVTKFNNKSNLPYASSATAIPPTACSSGYVGSPTYTCTTPGAAVINTSQCSTTPTYQWVLESSSVKSAGCEYDDGSNSAIATCNSTRVGKFAIVGGGTVSISGANLTVGNYWDLYTWYSQYCTTSGCNLPCGTETWGTSGTAKAYKCVYQ